MSPVLLAIISFIVGVLMGWLISSILKGSKSAAKLQEELDELQETHAKYKEDVDRHFVQTSNLVNNLTQSYKEVHEHLSKGAQTLCSDDLAQLIQQSTMPLIADAIDGEKADDEAVPAKESDNDMKKTSSDNQDEIARSDKPIEPETSSQTEHIQEEQESTPASEQSVPKSER